MLYVRAHHILGIGVALAVMTAVDGFFGSRVLELPAMAGGGSGLPMRRMLPLGFAAVGAGGLHSGMEQFERVAGAAVRKYELWHALVMFATTVLLIGGVEMATSDSRRTVTAVRALIIWWGLALVSGAAFGRWLSWVFPLITIFPLTYLQQNGRGEDRWWDWAQQPPSTLPCWVLAAIAVVIGAGAFAWTPWRRQRLTRAWTRA
ncbi:hypothetical protein KGQ20_02625 [Catenulispora sp. NF23]|uniref:hypothetical protein n=1 Tax=Catenulispora pinistramenti TaxID=2705254 RepID=UPI001BAABD38|nr:hypothetical protein [Catenulispora pinistramenti]MBS2531660.1 hypothetical protein [Catenulispora pinistramenti]